MNPLRNIKKLANNVVRLCILLSAVWIVGVSTLYFIEIYYHGSRLVPTESFNEVSTVYSARYDLFHDYYDWNTKTFSDWELVANADPEELTGIGTTFRVCILHPGFSVVGFLKLIFIPMLLGWLLALIIYSFIWKYRKEILLRVLEKIEKMDPLFKLLVLLGTMGSYLILYLLGFSHLSALCFFGLVLVVVPLSCLLIKKTLYGLVYVVIKAIKDAKSTF